MRVLPRLEERFRAFKKGRRVARARTELARRVAQGEAWQARPHGLSRRLVVSLTSFPKRFDTLMPTLQSLLFQTVRPDEVQLWIAHGDVALLPDAVRQLEPLGLDIRTCKDLRSYKKIIPALSEERESVIVTADDDIYYWPTWLEELVEAYRETANPVIAHRAHGLLLQANGFPEPYQEWERPIHQRTAGPKVFPIGAHGVLYDARIFHPDVFHMDDVRRLCPNGDDIWLYWMHRRNGSKPLVLAIEKRVLEWPGSQTVALRRENTYGGGNDRAIGAMIAEFGFPRD